nr:placenta-specific protein 9 [Parambassis ranga]
MSLKSELTSDGDASIHWAGVFKETGRNQVEEGRIRERTQGGQRRRGGEVFGALPLRDSFLSHTPRSSSPAVLQCSLLIMVSVSSSSIGLLLLLTLLLIGCAAAGPEPDRRPRAVRSSACQEHTNLHSRLDVVEKKVEDTVEKLEVELAALLDAIDAPEWRPLLDDTGKTAVDILEEPGQRGQS